MVWARSAQRFTENQKRLQHLHRQASLLRVLRRQSVFQFVSRLETSARAWVSHACGVFHEPTAGMRSVPGLVTCGDADAQRYVISRNFVEKYRKKGCNIIWRSFPNHPHDVPPDSLRLAREFLTYYHKIYSSDLTERGSRRDTPPVYPYIGDDQEGVFYPANSPKAKNILPEDRVLLPALTIARAWGVPE